MTCIIGGEANDDFGGIRSLCEILDAVVFLIGLAMLLWPARLWIVGHWPVVMLVIGLAGIGSDFVLI